jgi:transcriptional regulator with XRE-family HTH domain
MNSTALSNGEYRRPMPVVMSLLAFGLQVGTGGAATPDYYKARGDKGYSFVVCEPDTGSAPASRSSPADSLAFIRTILRPSVSDLAKALGVSRQAVYDWQAGRPIAAGNVARIEDVARAAEIFAREGLQATPQLMRRTIVGGKNFFEILREGGSAESSARTLIDIVRRELNQRQSLQARLAKRPRPARDEFQDAGTPMLDETV